MIRLAYVEKYAEVLRNLKEHDGKYVNFPDFVRKNQLNAGLRNALIKGKFIEVDKRGFIKVLYDDSYPLHARRYLQEQADKQAENVHKAPEPLENTEVLITRVKQLLSALDYEQLTDYQSKCVLLVESVLKKF